MGKLKNSEIVSKKVDNGKKGIFWGNMYPWVEIESRLRLSCSWIEGQSAFFRVGEHINKFLFLLISLWFWPIFGIFFAIIVQNGQFSVVRVWLKNYFWFHLKSWTFLFSMFSSIPTVDFDLRLNYLWVLGPKWTILRWGNIKNLFLGHLKTALGSTHTAEGLLFSNDIQFCL